MKKILLLLGVWMMVGCNFGTGDYVRLANKKMDKQDYNGAIILFNRALLANTLNPDAYFGRALAKYHIQNYTGAISDYTKAVNIRHDFISALYRRAAVKLQLGDTSGSIADYIKIIAIDTNYGAAYCNRGKVKLIMDDYNGAITDVTKAIEAERYDTATHNYKKDCFLMRSIAKKELKDIRGAIADADTALQLNPKNAFTNINKGILEYDTHNYADANIYLTSALKINSKLPDAYYYLAMIDFKAGNNDIAHNELNKAAKCGLDHGQDTIKKYCK